MSKSELTSPLLHDIPGIFASYFQSWLYYFLLILSTATVLTNIDSFLNNEPALALFADYCINNVMLMTLALAVATLLCVTHAVFSVVPAFRKTNPVRLFSNIILSILLAYILYSIFKLWLSTYGILFHIPRLLQYFALLIVFVIATIKWRAIYELRLPMRNLAYVVAAVSIAVTGLRFASAAPEPVIQPTAAPQANATNVILFTFDAMSARDLSLYGYERPTTPNLERMGRRSAVFDHALAASNWTHPCASSIITGRYPVNHRHFSVLELSGAPFDDNGKGLNLPAVFKAHGYATAAVVANLGFAHPVCSGSLEAFDYAPLNTSRLDLSLKSGTPLGLIPVTLTKVLYRMRSCAASLMIRTFKRDLLLREFSDMALLRTIKAQNRFPVELDTALALDWLDAQARRSGGPFFMWVHVIPPHEPYVPPAPFKGRLLPGSYEYNDAVPRWDYVPRDQQTMDNLRKLYNEFIMYADDAFGKFYADLASRGLLANTAIIVSADHGESFENGYWGHGGPELYDQLTHIPLLIQGPGMTQGRRVSGTVSQVDIAPTALALAGIVSPDWMDGESLVPAMSSGQASGRPRFSMQLDTSSALGKPDRGQVDVDWNGRRLLYDIRTGQNRLYDLERDPKAQKDIAADQPDLRDRMMRLAKEVLAGHKPQ